MKENFNIEEYKNYYGNEEFQNDLMRYFKVTSRKTNPPYPFIAFVAHEFNPYRIEGCPSSSRDKNFYFSFCLFFHALQAQGIRILSGEEMMIKFHAETGVPMISCGMGGLMHPAHMLQEAGLLPEGAEIPLYISMIDVILPAIRSQVEELSAYSDVEKLHSFIKKEVMKFRQRLEEREPHPSYLIPEGL
jgi:hypothetical protein